jgi:hypothetical protein
MKIRACLMAGIIGIAVVAGIFEALASPRKKEAEEKKEEGKTKTPEDCNCDGL